MSELLDCIAEHVDRIKTLAALDRPSLRLVYFDEREEVIEPVTLLGAFSSPPICIDLGERRMMIFIALDRSDFHGSFALKLRDGQRIDAVVFGMGSDDLYKGHLSAEIESHLPATSNLTRSRFRTFDFGAALWTSSVEAQCAALTGVAPDVVSTTSSARRSRP